MRTTMCVHQFFRRAPSCVTPPGYGNCSICTADERNVHCGGYVPISVGTFEVCATHEHEHNEYAVEAA